MVQRSIDDEIQNPGDSSFASVIRAARARAVAVRPDRPVEVNFAERGELISPARVFPVHKQLSPIHRCLPDQSQGFRTGFRLVSRSFMTFSTLSASTPTSFSASRKCLRNLSKCPSFNP